MAPQRRTSGARTGWGQAIVFNLLLLLIPVLGANVVAGVFAAREVPVTPTTAALTETRAQMDLVFADLVPRGADRRDFWADLVDRELRARDIAAARGYLVAAPDMLDADDVRAIEAAAEADPFGTRDEQLTRAALLFLPSDARARYETANRLPAIAVATTQTSEETDPPAVSAAAAPTRPEASSSAFLVLGSFEDLTRHSRSWLERPDDPGFSVRITGLGLIADGIADTGGVDLPLATSILKAAHRAGRLHPGFERRLNQDMEAALPRAVLRTRLADALGPVAPTSQHAIAVEQAFRDTLREEALGAILTDARQINEIADATSPTATVALVEHVRSRAELNKLRLIVEAGGERALALEKQIGQDMMATARTGISLSTETVIQIMGLAAAVMVALLLTITSLQASFRARRHAIGYL